MTASGASGRTRSAGTAVIDGSAGYDDRYDQMLADVTGKLVDAARPGAGDTVLDIGCGTGAATLRTAGRVMPGTVVGMDTAPILLATAAERARLAGVTNAWFEIADVRTHPLPAAGFDVALSQFALPGFGDDGRVWQNVARTLRPGGRLAFTCFQDPARSEYLVLLRAAVVAILGGRIEPDTDLRDESDPFTPADPERIRRLLDDAGFDDVEVRDPGATFWMGTDPDAAATWTLDTPAARAALDDASSADVAAVHRVLAGLFTPRTAGDGVRLDADIWMVTARRADLAADAAGSADAADSASSTSAAGAAHDA